MSVALKARLLGIMKRHMSYLDFHPNTYCEYQFEKLVGQGVERMRINNAVDQVNKIIQAEQNVRHLINYFCDYSKQVGTFPVLNDDAFDSALISCPPLWPYRC